jgi:uncharacterized protein YndB with AHSA1/START domain
MGPEMQERSTVVTTRIVGAPPSVLREVLTQIEVHGLDGTRFLEPGGLALRDDGALAGTTRSTAPAFVLDTRVDVAPLGDGARIEVTSVASDPAQDAAGPLAGLDEAWRTALDEVAASVGDEASPTAERSITGSVTLDAPPDDVWELWTRPEHASRWWGPDDWHVDTDDMDVRPGGAWRFTMADDGGQVFRNDVVYIAVEPPRRIVFAHGEHEAPDRFVAIATFEPSGGRTNVSLESRFPSREDRQRAADEYGATEGLRQTLANLERYLEDVGRPGIVKMRHDGI